MYDYVIVPFDGSEAAREAARVATDLARALEANLRVVTATDAHDSAALAALKDQAMAMSNEDINVWVEPGRSPAEAINTVLAHRPSSLVCMSTTARTGVRRAVYGSLFEELLDRPEVPVLVLGPEAVAADPFDVRHLVVTVTEDVASHDAIPLAARWAKEFELPVSLLHVAPRQSAGVAFDLRPLAAELEAVAPVVDPVVVFDDEPARAILGVLERSPGALAVMTTHRRVGMARLRRGSIVTDVVRHSPLPVLVQRAADPTLTS